MLYNKEFVLMDYARLEKQMEFCKEIDKEKLIGRQTYLTDGSRKENDAEHAWHMALMAVVLQEYSNEEIDLLKSMTMMLIHDIVEIDAGDTFAYDEEGKKDQRERELKAAERLFGMLPEDQGAYFRQLWDEFEAMSTPEARFDRTLDNIQHKMLNASSGGKGWSEKGVHIDQVMERQSYTGDGSRVLWDYSLNNYIKPNVEKGTIKSK